MGGRGEGIANCLLPIADWARRGGGNDEIRMTNDESNKKDVMTNEQNGDETPVDSRMGNLAKKTRQCAIVIRSWGERKRRINSDEHRCCGVGEEEFCQENAKMGDIRRKTVKKRSGWRILVIDWRKRGAVGWVAMRRCGDGTFGAGGRGGGWGRRVGLYGQGTKSDTATRRRGDAANRRNGEGATGRIGEGGGIGGWREENTPPTPT